MTAANVRRKLNLEIRAIQNVDNSFELACQEIIENAHYIKAFKHCGVVEMVSFYDADMEPVRFYTNSDAPEIVAYVNPCNFKEVAIHQEMQEGNLYGANLTFSNPEDVEFIEVEIGQLVSEEEAWS